MAPGKFTLCQAARSGVLANDSHALGYEQPVEAELLVLLSAVVARCFPLTLDGPGLSNMWINAHLYDSGLMVPFRRPGAPFRRLGWSVPRWAPWSRTRGAMNFFVTLSRKLHICMHATKTWGGWCLPVLLVTGRVG